jgi:hypothetical protein
MVFKVNVYLYGTPDAMYQFEKVLSTHLEMEHGFKRSEKDPQQYWRIKNGNRQQIGIHVDDGIMKGKLAELEEIIRTLEKRFKIKHEVEPKVFLGLNIWRNREKREIAISQYDYIMEAAERFGPIPTNKRYNLPLEPDVDLTINKDEPSVIDKLPLQELIGTLLHATITRKDILCAVGKIARFMSNGQRKHYEAAKQILFHLVQTADLALVLGKFSDDMLKGNHDAGFAKEFDFRSRTGSCLFYWGSLILALSKVQKLTTISTAESEYVAANEGCVSHLYVHQYLGTIGIKAPTEIVYVDNQAAISMTKDLANYNRTKHIAIRYHSTKGFIDDGYFKFEYIKTDDNVADIFTKLLARPKFEKFRSMLGYRFGYTTSRRSDEMGKLREQVM